MIKTYNAALNPVPNFGASISTNPGATKAAVVAPTVYPVQWVGFVPLVCCTPTSADGVFSACDCRTWPDDDCYINPVFASSTDTAVLKNDKNSFLLEYPFYYQYLWNNNANSSFKLQKWTGAAWTTVGQLNSNTYGTYYNFGDLCIKQLKGYQLEWRKVLLNHGEGMYRVRVDSIIFLSSTCLVSEPFCLSEWTCHGVDKTVRWEAYIEGGRIGSITDPKKLFIFCCTSPGKDGLPATMSPVTWYDSIRLYGIFHAEKSRYEKVEYEYDDGTKKQHKNEIIQRFEWRSAALPKYLHDRFKTYANMADRLYVSDFNRANPDYEIDQILVTCVGEYAPEPVMVKGEVRSRLNMVVVEYEEGIQNVIRDTCCGTAKPRSGRP